MDFRCEQILIDEVSYTVKIAETADQRKIGLSRRTDVGADGMLFSYDYPVYRPFHMRHTIIPLVIAFFDANLDFIGAKAMQPLATSPVLPPGPFQYAIEFPLEVVPELRVGRSRLKRPMKTEASQ